MDSLTPEARSRLMASIRSKDTGPEMIVRRIVHGLGFRYSLHGAGLPGKPDIVLTRHGKIILVHGCFWHRHPGCALASNPKTRRAFWNRKFRSNVERDERVRKALRALGWRVLIVWECETRKADRLTRRIERFMARE